MGSATKATPIQFIDRKSRIKKWRDRKTTLSGYYACLSRDLLLMALRADTHTHTNVRGQNDFKKPGTRGPVACMHLVLKLLKKNCIQNSNRLMMLHMFEYFHGFINSVVIYTCYFHDKTFAVMTTLQNSQNFSSLKLFSYNYDTLYVASYKYCV